MIWFLAETDAIRLEMCCLSSIIAGLLSLFYMLSTGILLEPSIVTLHCICNPLLPELDNVFILYVSSKNFVGIRAGESRVSCIDGPA